MIDAKKSAEINMQISELMKQVSSRQSNIAKIEQEKTTRVKYYDQQIMSEQNQLKQLYQKIDYLNKQLR